MLRSKDISLLYDFSVVCRVGNLTKAAKELGTVQSAVTQRMQRLEDILGTSLLLRHSRGVSATDQGLILLNYARQLNTLVANAVAEVEAWEGSPSGAVSIGLPPSVSAVLTSPLIKAVKDELPNVELTVAEAFSGYLNGWLENEEIDLGFVFDKKSSNAMVITDLVEEDLYLITDAKTAKRLPHQLSLNDLANLPLIAPSRRHALRTDVEREADRQDVQLNIVLEVDAGHQLIRQIEQGVGSAILARSAVMPELVENKLVSLPIINPNFQRTVCLAVKREKAETYLLTRVRDVIERAVDSLIEDGHWPGVRVQGRSHGNDGHKASRD